MNLLTRVDLAIGGVMDKIFTLRGECQPLDLARLLRRAVTTNERKTLKSVYAPNRYTILLTDQDMARIEPIKNEIMEDLELVLQKILADQSLLIVGPTHLELAVSPELGPKQV